MHERTFDICGDYTARVERPDGTTSPACEFAVCDLDLRLPADRVSLGQRWEVRFTSDNMREAMKLHVESAEIVSAQDVIGEGN